MKKIFSLLLAGVFAFGMMSCDEDEPKPNNPVNPGDTVDVGLSSFPFVADGHVSTYVLSINGTAIDSSITNTITKVESGDYESVINLLGQSDVTYLYEQDGILRGYVANQARENAGQVLNSQPYDGETWIDEIEGDSFEFTVLDADAEVEVPAGTFTCAYIRQVLVGGSDTVYTYINAEHGIIELQFQQLQLDARASLLEKNF